MTNRAAAARYARALFSVSVKEQDLRRVAADLGGFLDLVEGHEMLKRVLRNPGIPASRKRAIVADILARLGGVTAPVAELLALLAERGRLGLLREVAGLFRARVLDHLDIVEAYVTTAYPLTSGRTAATEHKLVEATGHKVTMTTNVDSEILGGVVVRLGTTVYDASVARQIERMRQVLLES